MIRILGILCLLICTTTVAKVPTWFGNSEQFPVKNRYQYIEFSEGKTLEEARTNARTAIAASIRVRVQSDTLLSETYSDTIAKSHYQEQLKTQVDVMLSSPLKILKAETVNDKVWLAVSYDSTPAILRLQKLAVSDCDKPTSSYFIQFERSLGLATEQCLPPFSLNAEQGFWQLLFRERRVIVDEEVLRSLFHPYKEELFSVKHTINRLKPYQPYFISINAGKTGYLSLIQLYQNGQSAILLDNQYIARSQQVVFPNKKLSDGLINVLDAEDQQNRDLTLALLCDVKQDFTAYSTISSLDTTGYQRVSPDLLFRKTGCKLATDVMVTTR